MAQDADSLQKPHVPILMKLWPQGQGGHCKGDHSARVKDADISKVLYKNLSCIIKEVFIYEEEDLAAVVDIIAGRMKVTVWIFFIDQVVKILIKLISTYKLCSLLS